MQRFSFDNCSKQAYVHRSRAKLEWERIPLVVKVDLTAIDMITEINLLVYFQNSYEKRFNQQKTANEGFALVRTMFGERESAKDGSNNKEHMERPVERWDGHLCVKQG